MFSEKYNVNLTKYVPPFIYKNNEIIQAIYKSQNEELGSLLYCFEDLINQYFIDTATWGLAYWEQEFGIITDETDTYENRRSRIKAKKVGQGTCTKKLIKDVASRFTNGEVDVIEHSEYYFTIKFISKKGIPAKIQDLKDVIEEIKPAHLGVEYEFTYNTWNYAKDFKWGELKSYTWEELLNNNLEHNSGYTELYYKDKNNKYTLLTFR